MLYDLIIIGGGPAGVAAGIYAARKKIKTLLVTNGFGGQSLSSSLIQNFIGRKSISGYELAKSLEDQLRAQEDIEIIDSDLIVKVEKADNFFIATSEKGQRFETRTVLVVSGSRRRKLEIVGADKFEGRGLAYCAICDAALFKNKAVAVIGGSNTALEAVIDLLSHASKVYLIYRGEKLKGDPVTRDKVEANSKVEIIAMAQTQEILGDEFISGLRYKDSRDNQIKELRLDGVFVEIGSTSNSDMVKDLVNLNDRGEIIVDHKTQKTSQEGIWAAGDVTDVFYKQNNIAIGDAIKAVLNVCEFLQKTAN